ncbi:hypothetical protein GCM10010218_53080 [Streptomyces mashuensis]|uniref:HTH cro/C1-type domain-containing protein n=1 Tax=Streptomyces mashuensis TaxID=33904 RepID=A0A919B8J3_9ACTN|nr:helix-turn-helix transcriptional regulator [Streptomyces mashuensis]GHF65009.1 hypothetical protein GCM10010218_53080 [Streptomyces mashuensis]
MIIGDLIRELRTGRGWSQGRLASELNAAFGTSLTREYVSGWERSRVRPGPFYLRCLAAVLEVPVAVLDGRPETAHGQGLLSGVAATSVAPAVAADLLDLGFAARLRGGPSEEEWEDLLARYGEDYMAQGAAELQRRVVSDLVVVQQQLGSPRMWSVAARLMTFYATTFGAPDQDRAVTWFRTAVEAADRSGDRATRVWVRGRAALTLGYGRFAPGLAHLLAEQALAIDDTPSTGLLNALLGKAYAAAGRGDTGTALELAGRSRRVFDAAPSAGRVSDFAVASWRLSGFLSLLSARLGDEKGALRAHEEARRELPGTLPRFATHLELHRGLMLVRAGDRAGGVAHARAALEALPPSKYCGTLRMLMAEISEGAGAAAAEATAGAGARAA